MISLISRTQAIRSSFSGTTMLSPGSRSGFPSLVVYVDLEKRKRPLSFGWTADPFTFSTKTRSLSANSV